MLATTKGRLHHCFANYHPKEGKPYRVFVDNHTYNVDGYLSNFVLFRKVLSGGKLGGTDRDYDYEKNFTQVRKARITYEDPLTGKLIHSKGE